MTELLGSQKVRRSARAVDSRPVRFEMPADLGPVVELPCFAGCTLPVKAERLHRVTTALTCDGACRSARRPWCECGCGGINHGRVWGQGALLDSREVVESEIARYRAEQVKIEQRREARREAAARTERNAFDRWAADRRDIITALEPWYQVRNDEAAWPRHWGAHILADFARQLRWDKPRPLTDPQVSLARRILGELAEKQRQEAERQARRAAKPGAGDQAAWCPGSTAMPPTCTWSRATRSTRPGARPWPRPAATWARRPGRTTPGCTPSAWWSRPPGSPRPAPRSPLSWSTRPGSSSTWRCPTGCRWPGPRSWPPRYAACIVCGRTLKAAKSVRQAVGPVCIKMFGPVITSEAA